MKILWSWLDELVQGDKSTLWTPENVAAMLTRAGSETHVSRAYAWAKNFFVAQVDNVIPHPRSEHLNICSVTYGEGRHVTVVCGASNVRVHMRTILALPGAFLPGVKEPLSLSSIRGETSHGMLCSAQELCISDLFPPTEEGIIVLDNHTVLGTTLYDLLPEEYMLDVEVTPQRGDLLSHYGMARELRTLFAYNHHRVYNIQMSAYEKGNGGEYPPSVTIATEKCPFFSLALFSNVQHNPSPDLIKRRLSEIGITCHFSCVDMSNYVSECLGQPLHVFDADEIVGSICVRLSTEGENFLGLDQKEYTLPEGCVVIADDEGIISLAGIMGGYRGRCTSHSKRVVVEIASFDPHSVLRAGRLTGIQTQARYRFERGVSPHIIDSVVWPYVMEWMTAHTHAQPGNVMRYGSLKVPSGMYVSWDSISGISGIVDMDKQDCVRRLRCGEAVVEEVEGGLHITPPTWRPLWTLPEECCEEAYRLDGWDAIPLIPHVPPIKGEKPSLLGAKAHNIGKKARLFLLQKCNEVVTWSFFSEQMHEQFPFNDRATKEALTICNPLSSQHTVMRSSVLGNLLHIYAYHKRYNVPCGPLFEYGPCYDGTAPEQQRSMITVFVPSKPQPYWERNHTPTFFTLKGLCEGLLSALGAHSVVYSREGLPTWYHPGMGAALFQGTQCVGYVGAIHPKISSEGWGIEINLSVLDTAKPQEKPYENYELQAVVKDLSFFIPSTLCASDFMAGLALHTIKDVHNSVITDVFDDPQQGRSLSVRFTFQPQESAYTGQEINTLMEQIAARAQVQGCRLRGSL